MQPTHLRTRRAFTGRRINVDIETIQNPRGSTVDLEVVRHPGAAAVVPFVSDPAGPDPTILLIHQYRYATGSMIWEIPAGVLEPGEDPANCARRELEEETGARAKDIRHLTTIHTTPGFTDERIHLFMAADLEIAEPDHEPDEFIDIVTKPLTEVLTMTRDGEISDGKTVCALLYVAGFTLNP